jgi:hypothetical protein
MKHFTCLVGVPKFLKLSLSERMLHMRVKQFHEYRQRTARNNLRVWVAHCLRISHVSGWNLLDNGLSLLSLPWIFWPTPWPESASELYRPSDRRLSPKLVPNFVDIRCHVVSVTDPYRILGFLDRSSDQLHGQCQIWSGSLHFTSFSKPSFTIQTASVV